MSSRDPSHNRHRRDMDSVVKPRGESGISIPRYLPSLRATAKQSSVTPALEQSVRSQIVPDNKARVLFYLGKVDGNAMFLGAVDVRGPSDLLANGQIVGSVNYQEVVAADLSPGKYEMFLEATGKGRRRACQRARNHYPEIRSDCLPKGRHHSNDGYRFWAGKQIRVVIGRLLFVMSGGFEQKENCSYDSVSVVAMSLAGFIFPDPPPCSLSTDLYRFIR